MSAELSMTIWECVCAEFHMLDYFLQEVCQSEFFKFQGQKLVSNKVGILVLLLVMIEIR